MDKLIRVLITDDHFLFRDGLVALINSVDDIIVVCAAQDRPENCAQSRLQYLQ
jgi:DNA-binding NarL/FixJ family response regulator